MKYKICIRALFAVLLAFTTQKNYAQDSATPDPSPILHLYYDIKDALVTGNATAAAVKATAFISVVNISEKNLINDETKNALLKEAGNISKTKDIAKQPESF